MNNSAPSSATRRCRARPFFLSQLSHSYEVLGDLGETLLAFMLHVPGPVDLLAILVVRRRRRRRTAKGWAGQRGYQVLVDLFEGRCVVLIQFHLLPQLGRSMRALGRLHVKVEHPCSPRHPRAGENKDHAQAQREGERERPVPRAQVGCSAPCSSRTVA